MTSFDLNSLPLAPLRNRFHEALATGPVVLAAPTGSGKSTLVPLWCGREGLRTLVVEPRRVACRALYRFLRQVGDVDVAYTVRHDQRGPKNAAVRFVTPGVALRLLAAGDLDRFDCVVLDEFHERSMDGDLILAHLKEHSQEHSKEHSARTVVMSATLQVEDVARWLGATPLQAEGRSYPVDIAYLGGVNQGGVDQGGADLPTSKNLGSRVLSGVKMALARSDEGDVLVFLPGKGEIRDAAAGLAGKVDAAILELHAQLPRDQQDRVFAPSPARRVILATNVAETSLTIPSVRAVVDSGLERRTTYRRARSILSLSPISTQSATQRAGRAGRVAAGVAIRLWSERGILRPDTTPEILREDLDQLLLHAGGLGRTTESLDFLDPPDPGATTAARDRLEAMELVAPDGTLTPLGKAAARLPLDPLLARLVLEAQKDRDDDGDRELLEDVIDLVATLAHGAPLFQPSRGATRHTGRNRNRDRNRVSPPPPEPEPSASPVATAGCDAVARIRALRVQHPQNHGLRPYALKEARRISEQLRALLQIRPPKKITQISGPTRRMEVHRQKLAALVLRAYPPAAFVRRRTRFASPGLEVELGRESLVDPEAEALVVLDLRSKRSGSMRAVHTATCAIPVTRRWLAEQSVGEETVTRVRLEGDVLWGQVEQRYAEVTLARREVVLKSNLAVEGAAELMARGSVFPGLADRLNQALQLTASWYAHRRETPPTDLSLRPWLVHRLAQLGLQDGGDLALLTPEDLLPGFLTPADRESFEAKFPPRLTLQDRRCRVEYDFAARRVDLVHEDGNIRHPPSPSMLPIRWPGFEVHYRVHSRSWKIL